MQINAKMLDDWYGANYTIGWRKTSKNRGVIRHVSSNNKSNSLDSNLKSVNFLFFYTILA